MVEEVAGPALWEAEREERFPVEIVPAFRDAGLVGGTIPVELGGLGWDLITHLEVIEEVSKTSQVLGSFLAVPGGPVGAGLMQHGTEEQKERWLRPLASGELLAGYGLTEPRSGTDAARMVTRAERVDGGGRCTAPSAGSTGRRSATSSSPSRARTRTSRAPAASPHSS